MDLFSCYGQRSVTQSNVDAAGIGVQLYVGGHPAHSAAFVGVLHPQAGKTPQVLLDFCGAAQYNLLIR